MVSAGTPQAASAASSAPPLVPTMRTRRTAPGQPREKGRGAVARGPEPSPSLQDYTGPGNSCQKSRHRIQGPPHPGSRTPDPGLPTHRIQGLPHPPAAQAPTLTELPEKVETGSRP
eukprot:196991-Chlamydomonas_euryale.AAC.1